MTAKSGATKRRYRRKNDARSHLLEKRLALADELAGTPTTTVTLRLPSGLNQWLDGYVHGAWQTKVRKQALVIEALRLLIARRGGPGEDLVPTPLLGEDQTTEQRP